MKIAFLPKTKKDLKFIEKFKERNVDVILIKEKHLFSKFSNNKCFFGYFNEDSKDIVKNLEKYLENHEKYDLDLKQIDLFFLRHNELFNRVDNFFEIFFRILETEGINIINSVDAIRKTKNKFYSYYLLSNAGINIPESFVSMDYNKAYLCLKEYKKLVFKPIQGKGGSGIVITEDISTGGDVLSLFAISKRIPIIQKFIENDKDMRIIVVGDEVVGGIYRVRKFGRKNNISLGGEAIPFNVSDELKELALKSTKVLECEISGVDIVEADGKYIVLEVNSSPGFSGFQKATGIDVYGKIVDYLIDKIKK